MIVEVHGNYSILDKNGKKVKNICDVSLKDFLAQMLALKKYGEQIDINLITSKESLHDKSYTGTLYSHILKLYSFIKWPIEKKKEWFEVSKRFITEQKKWGMMTSKFALWIQEASY